MKSLKVVLLVLLFSSCSRYLDIVPDNIATLDFAFRDRLRAEQYLFTCYSYMPRFGSGNDPALVGDEIWSVVRDAPSYPNKGFDIMYAGNNATNPNLDYWGGTNGATNLWAGIRDCNIFLENVGGVHDLLSAERDRWTAEVKFLKAFYHFFLLQLYGPIPIVDENLPVAATPEQVAVYREPVDDVVEYVVSLIDEAVAGLPLRIENEISEMGRITQAIALAVKAKVLVTAASPLFNGNADYPNLIDNRNRELFNPVEDPKKWIRAAAACKEAIELCHRAGHKLYHFENKALEMSDTTRQVLEVSQILADKWNEEMIWGWGSNIKRGVAGPNGFLSSYDTEIFSLGYLDPMWRSALQCVWTPTMKMVEMFYSNNGVPIDEDRLYDYDRRYQLTTVPQSESYYMQPGYVTAGLHLHREPRFYGSVGVDGGWWFGLGRFNDQAQWPIRSRFGQVGGMGADGRYTETSFYLKKTHHYESVFNGLLLQEKKWNWPIFRLADLYLLYAEALNETMERPSDEVYMYVNLVRARAGLKSVEEAWTMFSKYPEKFTNQSGMREIIHRERAIELAFERHRFYDVRRWKKSLESFSGAGKAWDIREGLPERYYQLVSLRYIDYGLRDVFWPIPQNELFINKNLRQNYGW